MRNDMVARCGADLPAHAWVPAPRIVFGASGHRGCSLAEPLPVQFTVLEEKFLGRAVHHGLLTELSDFETRLSSSYVLAVLSNLKITVGPTSQGNPSGEIYGKVVDVTTGTPGLARVRFTSATPELKAWVTARSSA
jgi:hypothetical protein